MHEDVKGLNALGNGSDLRDFLSSCVASPATHARLLNTFAYLEHMGARKIHRFQRFGVGGPFVLKHAAEEARHAWHFKRQIGRVHPAGVDLQARDGSLASAESTEWPELADFGAGAILGGQTTRSYLRRLDVAVNRHLVRELAITGKQQYLTAYLLVTTIIELRANELYPLYAEILHQAKVPVKVDSVVKEERQHLAEMRLLLAPLLGDRLTSTLDQLRAIEATHFAAWLRAVALGPVGSVVH